MKPESDPFPHLILDGYWNPELLVEVRAELIGCDFDRFSLYANEHEGKLAGDPPFWGPTTHRLYKQIAMLPMADWFDIPDLVCDPIGGGYHVIPPGGHLDVHVDFNRHPTSRWFRRLNCLVFLNEDWDDPGGHLELHGKPFVDVAPEFNRTVVFATSDSSWHGHPRSASRWRYSFAAYFFAPDPPPGYKDEHSTVWADDA